MESTEIGREAKVYESLGVEGTNQGLVAFTSQSIHYICRFTFKEQEEVRYSTN